MRRMDRLSYLIGRGPGPIPPERITFVGRAGAVAVVVFLLLVVVTAVNDRSVSQTSLGGKTYALTAASAPKGFAADKGALLGLSADDAIKLVKSSKFKALQAAALDAPRKRKMIDLTRDPKTNSMQVLLNTWTTGSFSPVHRHTDYSEAFVILSGTLAFFTFSDDGKPTCHLLREGGEDRAIVVEQGQWHAMTSYPSAGHAVVFEISGHVYSPTKQTKELAPFAPSVNQGLDGDPRYFADKLLPLCRSQP